MALNLIRQICNEPHGLGASFKTVYYPVRNPTIPNVRTVIRRKILTSSSANCVHYICCILVRVANRVLSKVIFEKHMKNRFPWENKLNPAFMFHCTSVSAIQLTWPKQHNWLTRPVGSIEWWSLIGVQASSCGSNKHKMLTYLAKNNINGIIQTVSDEDKRKESEYWNILCQRMELEDQFLKWNFREDQNSKHIVGRENKYEKNKLFPSMT